MQHRSRPSLRGCIFSQFLPILLWTQFTIYNLQAFCKILFPASAPPPVCWYPPCHGATNETSCVYCLLFHYSRKLPFGPLLSRYHCIAYTKYHHSLLYIHCVNTSLVTVWKTAHLDKLQGSVPLKVLQVCQFCNLDIVSSTLTITPLCE